MAEGIADNMAEETVKPIVAVFANAKEPKERFYGKRRIRRAAELLGQKLGEAGYDVLYGGGSMGVMGWVTNMAHNFGSQIYSLVMKRFAGDKEATPAIILDNESVNEYQRMPKFCHPNQTEKGAELGLKDPEAFFVLPGGSGTMRELTQAIEEIAYNNGPPVIVVKVGRWNRGIIKDFDRAVKAGAIKKECYGKVRIWNPKKPLSKAFEDRVSRRDRITKVAKKLLHIKAV